MKTYFLSITLLLSALTISAQSIKTSNKQAADAFNLALWTIDNNTDENSLLKAGANYGGEWTRDISINSWNAASQLRPDVAEYSLWSVTNDHKTIGHQYWDRIIWTIAAWNHYLVTGREQFLTDAYECCRASMVILEDSVMDKQYGLFTGPAVFQDGIAAYDEPVYDPALDDKSYVLDHPNSHAIKCLSTNAVYYQAYVCLAEMAKLREPAAVKGYQKKADELKANFRKYFYNKKDDKLNYLIDHNGNVHDYQEGLGVAYAIMFGLVTEKEAREIIANTYQTKVGIPSVWPCFPRYSEGMPGRHNVMVWPHVNMYFAAACAQVGAEEPFWQEVNTIARLALEADKGADRDPLQPLGNYHEIYTADGVPSGGWQCSKEWPALNHQTWCATGMIRAYLYYIIGMQPKVEGLAFAPMGMEDGSEITLTNIPYRSAKLDITVKGKGKKIASCLIDGKQSKPFIPANAKGNHTVVITLR